MVAPAEAACRGIDSELLGLVEIEAVAVDLDEIVIPAFRDHDRVVRGVVKTGNGRGKADVPHLLAEAGVASELGDAFRLGLTRRLAGAGGEDGGGEKEGGQAHVISFG